MKFVSINSNELKEALLEGNRISIEKQSYEGVRYAVDNPSDVDEFFKYDVETEKMFFGYISKDKKNKYVFLLMQHNMYSSDTEKCLDGFINLITSLVNEVKQKSSKIKTLESEIEKFETEKDLDEIDNFIDSLDEVDNNSKLVAPISCQVKLPSQKSYITVDTFNMFT